MVSSKKNLPKPTVAAGPLRTRSGNVVPVAPLKHTAVVAMAGGGGQRRDGRVRAMSWSLWQSGGARLVLRLTNGASDTAP